MTTQPDQLLRYKGFRIEISGAGSGTDVDSAWETCTGGGLNIVLPENSTGSDQFHTTTPGHKYVDTLTLRGPITASRKWLTALLNAQAKGAQPTFDLTLTEILRDGSDGRSFKYGSCFLTRYVYPKLSADGTGNLYEEVHIKPIRLDLA